MGDTQERLEDQDDEIYSIYSYFRKEYIWLCKVTEIQILTYILYYELYSGRRKMCSVRIRLELVQGGIPYVEFDPLPIQYLKN